MGDRMREPGLSRRELLAAGAAAGAAIALDRGGARALAGRSLRIVERLDFADLADGPGWGAGWRSVGVANLRRAEGEGLLEAGSDVFPNDPRPVAFAIDRRLLDAEISATLTRVGSATGVVLRRTSPVAYYAAIYDAERGVLRILARDGIELAELASSPAVLAGPPAVLTLAAAGSRPTALRAVLSGPDTTPIAEASASDSRPRLQRPGDPGVFATAQTLFPSDPNPVLPALGNLHLLPWAVQEGQAVMDTAPGQAVIDEIRRRSTAGFAEIVVRAPKRARPTSPAVIAATTGPLVDGGARLHVAADLAAEVTLEVSYSPRFRGSRTVPGGRTGRFHGLIKTVRGLDPGRRVYWRAHLERRGRRATGPVRSFRTAPKGGAADPFRIAVGSCASQFGPSFARLAEVRPDVLVWQGDLNYPDTHGPLAQTMSGYAGIWRDFLANPVLTEITKRASFAPQRDDHDYGVQDANSTNIRSHPWGLAPWQALMNRRTFYRFRAGPAEVWVLDQRLHKSDPALPDTAAKTLLGERQRRWLLRTLVASKAAFKIVCSPTTVFMPGNPRDGNWAAGYGAERELVLDHVRRRVGGETIFLTGDVHLTGVYDAGGDYEVRAAPLGIPKPNDITLLDPLAAENLRARDGVAYAGDESHFTLLTIAGSGRGDALDLELVREDGAVPYSRRFGVAD